MTVRSRLSGDVMYFGWAVNVKEFFANDAPELGDLVHPRLLLNRGFLALQQQARQ